MKLTTILLVILMTFLLLVRYFFYFANQKNYKEGDRVNLTYSFLQEPRHNDYGQYFFISNILVTVPLYPRFHYADVVKLDGVISLQKNSKGEILVLKNPKVTLVKSNNLFLELSSYVRNKIENAVLETIPEKEAGLFLGIVLGVRDKIDNTFYEQLRAVGVLHIIAASGQNVSILASILLVSLSAVVKRRMAILFTAGGILFYALMSGFSPPIVRASVMALLSFGAMILGRQGAGLYTLAITGWGMLFLSPELISDVSFQLSFLSTFGIITVKPVFDNYINYKNLILVKEDLTTTISAQAATFPLMLASFGSYALLSLPVNLLLLWTIPPMMLDGILGLFLSVVSPFLAKPIIILSYPFLYYFTLIVNYFSSFNLNFGIENVPTPLIYGYYLILIAIVIKFHQHKGGKV